MLLDRHRLARLIELAELERRVTGPERLLREEDVALLVKAAYDEASDAARAEFMTRVKKMPTSAWPWSAVQAATTRLGGIVFSPTPGALAPATLVLLRGQVDAADADPGNRVPDRSRPESAAWEPLHKALDLWDTTTLKKWMAPQGWMLPKLSVMTQPAKATSVRPAGGVTTPPAGGKPTGGAGRAPAGPNGSGTPTGNPDPGTAAGDVTPPANDRDGGMMPTDKVPEGGAPTGDGAESGFSWRHPAVIAAGATALTTIGVVVYGLRRRPAASDATEESKP